jgi:hypothetical protein
MRVRNQGPKGHIIIPMNAMLNSMCLNVILVLKLLASIYFLQINPVLIQLYLVIT